MHICVIGAGVIGVTTAYQLSSRGHQVTLLDGLAQPAGLASAANGGQLSYSYVAPLAAPGVLCDAPAWLLQRASPLRFHPRPDPHQWQWLLAFLAASQRTTYERTTAQLLTLSFLSRDVLHALLAAEPLDFHWRRNGKLIIYRDAALLAKARELVTYQARHGANQSVLSRDEVLAREPSLAHLGLRLAGAVFTPDEEAGDCALFTRTLYERLAQRPGTDCHLNTTVRRLRREQGLITAVETDQGDVQADAYVVASGMGSRALLRPIGQNAPLYGLKGYSLSVPLLGKRDVGPDISVTDYQRRIVYARLGDTLRIAAMVDIGAEDNHPTLSRIEGLKRHVHDTFPQLDLTQAVPWAGLRPATPQGKPLIGQSRAAANLWLNIGHGALGFTLACGSAALLAAQIDGLPPPIDPTPFTP